MLAAGAPPNPKLNAALVVEEAGAPRENPAEDVVVEPRENPVEVVTDVAADLVVRGVPSVRLPPAIYCHMCVLFNSQFPMLKVD